VLETSPMVLVLVAEVVEQVLKVNLKVVIP
jgi:hypothetical protein